MKRFLLISVLLLSIHVLHARETYNINRSWEFFSHNDTSTDGALTVNLPHIWNSDALGGQKDYFRGIGNYLKTITIPSGWNDRRVFIRCGGANSVAQVFVNGKIVGEHRGGYTAFTFEITDHLLFGRENRFWIMVNNSPQTDVLPTAGDANVYGGLFRDVELIVTGKEIIMPTDHGSDGVYITQKQTSAEKAEGEVVVKVGGTQDNNNLQAHMVISNSLGDTVAQGSARVRLSGRAVSTAAIPFSIDNPVLWNGTDNPVMYNVTVKLFNGDNITDSITVKTGFRFFSVETGGGFHLNGRQYPLKGVTVTQDRAMSGIAISPYQVEEDFELIREIGANAVRITGGPHHPRFYELCDQSGIIVWNDFPLVGEAYLTDRGYFNTEAFRANGISQSTEIIRQLYNHPSVIMWGIFSNLNPRTGDDPLEYISSLNMTAKREDPSRLTVAASNDDGEINFITDLIVWDHHFGWKEGSPSDINVWKNQYKSRWGNLRTGLTYAAGSSILHQDNTLSRPPYQGNWHPERWQTHIHEEYYKHVGTDTWFWGIIVGNMFDYGAAGRTWGEGNGINDYGLVTFDRKYRKDAFWFYKANWSDDPFIYIAERRWTTRGSRNQTIKVFSNCDEVELFVNGASAGFKKGVNGTFIWPGITLDEGANTLEVFAGDMTDRITIEIVNSNGQNIIR